MRCVVFASLVIAYIEGAGVIATERIWDGGAGTTSWHDAANWDPDGVPEDGNDIVINLKGANVTVDATTALVKKLRCSEQLTLNNGTLNIDDHSFIRQFAANGGRLDGNGSIMITESMTWDAATIAGSGEMYMGLNTTLNITGRSGSPVLSRMLISYATTAFTARRWSFADGIFHNTGLFTIASNEPVDIVGLSGNSAFINEGHVGISGMVTWSDGPGSLAFHNDVGVSIVDGVIRVLVSGTGGGTFYVGPGGELSIGSVYQSFWVDNYAIVSVLPEAHLALHVYSQSPEALLRLALSSSQTPSVTMESDIYLAGALAATCFPAPPAYTEITLLTTNNGSIRGQFQTYSFAPPGSIHYSHDAVSWITYRTGDIDGDDIVNVTDLLMVINHWGPCPAIPGACASDVNADGAIDVTDLLQVISNWDPGNSRTYP